MTAVTQRSNRGMVSAPHALAAGSGARILEEGGTAIESAMAVAATLSVVYPHMTGLGGDSFWLIAEPGRPPVTIDGAGRAGAAVTTRWYRERGLHRVPWRGPLAANTVAGAVSAWIVASRINADWHGRLPLSRIFEDAITLADAGTSVTAGHAHALRQFREELETLPGFRELHYCGGAAPRTGDMLRQPALAGTFAALARDGMDSFYRGATARSIAAGLADGGIPLTAEDLAAQHARVGAPLRVCLPMAEVYNCRPPSQGLASLMILGLFARLGVERAESFAHVHGLVEATQLAFAVRDRRVGHREHPPGELESHLAAAELARTAARIDRRHAAPWSGGPGDGDTAWFGVIDAEGRAVSAIQSLYFEFGSGVALPQCGFVWQNRGCAFELDGGGPNVLAPGRQPFHTLNPAFARFHDGRELVYGAMGGDGQPQTQAALFTRYAFFDQDLQEAISAPRWVLGRTWRDAGTALRLEDRFPGELFDALRAAGHPVQRVDAFDQAMGHAGGVVHDRATGFQGASDPRSDGAAIGW
jgi:gamma-glutamyltranspeptidase/glutathione hydrolase